MKNDHYAMWFWAGVFFLTCASLLVFYSYGYLHGGILGVAVIRVLRYAQRRRLRYLRDARELFSTWQHGWNTRLLQAVTKADEAALIMEGHGSFLTLSELLEYEPSTRSLFLPYAPPKPWP